MSRLFSGWNEVGPVLRDDDALRAIAGTTRVRPGRCAGCSVAIVRPTGGPIWNALACPLCGSGIMQTTFFAKTVRRGVLVIDRHEAAALASGEEIEIENDDRHEWANGGGLVYCVRCGALRPGRKAERCPKYQRPS